MLPLRPLLVALISSAGTFVALAPSSGGSPAAAPLAGHVNKISPAAKDALDKYAKLVYRPIDLGLRTAAGNVTLDHDEHALASFSFTAPRTVRVEWTTEGAAQHRPPTMLGSLEFVLSAAFTGVPIPDQSEYDAELEHNAAGDVLVITCFRGELARTILRAQLDANGLATTVTMSPASAKSTQPSLATQIGWKKCGAKYRVESLSFPGAGIGVPGTLSFRLSYEQFGALAIVSGWTLDTTLRDQSQTLRFDVTDLTLDGKPAESRKPASK